MATGGSFGSIKIELYELDVGALAREVALDVFARGLESTDLLIDVSYNTELHSNADFYEIVMCEINAANWVRESGYDAETLRMLDKKAETLCERIEPRVFNAIFLENVFTPEMENLHSWKLMSLFFYFVMQLSGRMKHAGHSYEMCKHAAQCLLNATEAVIRCTDIVPELVERVWIPMEFITKKRRAAQLADRRRHAREMAQLTSAYSSLGVDESSGARSMEPQAQSSTVSEEWFLLPFEAITRELFVTMICQMDTSIDFRPQLSDLLNIHFTDQHRQVFQTTIQQAFDSVQQWIGRMPGCPQELTLVLQLFHTSPHNRFHYAIKKLLEDHIMNPFIWKNPHADWSSIYCLLFNVAGLIEQIKNNTEMALMQKVRLYRSIADVVYSLFEIRTRPEGLQYYTL